MEEYEDIEPELVLTSIYDGVAFYSVKTIFYRGNFWLAPRWRLSSEAPWIEPLRIIALENFSYSELRGQNSPVTFVVRDAIPQAILYGPIDKQMAQYKFIDQPKIRTTNRGHLFLRSPLTISMQSLRYPNPDVDGSGAVTAISLSASRQTFMGSNRKVTPPQIH